jgi:hypothetical protein
MAARCALAETVAAGPAFAARIERAVVTGGKAGGNCNGGGEYCSGVAQVVAAEGGAATTGATDAGTA